MQSTVSAPKFAWHALIWKDFQQVKPALVAISLGLIAMQFLAAAAAAVLGNYNSQQPLVSAITIGFMGPVLAIIASVGLLLGHERQMGSWAWSSSLPMSWRSALASKTAVAIGSSFLTFVPLAFVPTVLFALGYRFDTQGPFVELVGAQFLVLLIAVDVGVVLATSVLIFRESLTGLVVGAIWALFGQIMIVGLFGELVYRMLGASDDQRAQWANSIIVALFTLLFLANSWLFVALFRWRWGYGQTVELSVRRRQHVGERVRPLTRWEAAVASYPAPRSEFGMLFAQSLRVSWVSRACVAMAAFTLSVLCSMGPNTDPVFQITIIAAGALGFLTFDGDHVSRRFRFFADRGVSPLNFVLSRLTVTLAIATSTFVACIAYHYVQNQNGLYVGSLIHAVLFMAMFVLGTLCSLSFRRAIIGLVVAVHLGVLVAGIFLMVHMSDQLFVFDQRPEWFRFHVAAGVPVSCALGLVALIWLARKLMVQDSARLERHFAWIACLLIALPLVAPTLYGFLLLPRVPLQSVTRAQAWADAQSLQLPPLTDAMLGEALALDSANLLDVEQQLPGWQARTDRWISAIETVVQRAPEKLLQGEEHTKSADTQKAYYQTGVNLDRLIRSTATLGTTLATRGLTEQAQRLWVCNKQLQEFEVDGATLLATLKARQHSCELLNNWVLRLSSTSGSKRSQKRLEWGNAAQVRDKYLPDDRPLEAKMRYALREQATQLRWELCDQLWTGESLANGFWPWPLRTVPTLRWRQERSLAIETKRMLEAVDRIVAADQGNGEYPNVSSTHPGVLTSSMQAWSSYKTARRSLVSAIDVLQGPPASFQHQSAE